MLKVLVVDDHPVVRFGIKGILNGQKNISQVDEAENGKLAVELVKKHKYDIIFLDIQMPVLDGCTALTEILKIRPNQKVIILSSDTAGSVPKLMLNKGAKGFLNKDSGLTDVVKAVEDVIAGKRYISSELATEMAVELMAEDKNKKLSVNILSVREMETLVALANGLSINEAAESMGVSNRTISTYKNRIMTKLLIKTEMELLDFAVSENITDITQKI